VAADSGNIKLIEQEEALAKLKLIVKDLLDLEDGSHLNEKSRLREDLGIDSLGLVDFVVAIEDNFGVRFSSTFNAESILTLGDAVDLILVLQQGGSRA